MKEKIKLTFVIENGEIVDIEDSTGGYKKDEGVTIEELDNKHKKDQRDYLLQNLKPTATTFLIAQYNPTCVVWYSGGKYISFCK